jgi:hypothetical protein
MDRAPYQETRYPQGKGLRGGIPVNQINEINEFKSPNTYHLERALRLYVKVRGPGLNEGKEIWAGQVKQWPET